MESIVNEGAADSPSVSENQAGDTLPQLRRAEDGRMVAQLGEESHPVRISVCFPWTAPDRFISLRDAENKEVALIAEPSLLDPGSRAVLEQGLREANFAFEITRVEVLREEFEIRHWEVECTQGKRSFQTRKDDWPKSLPPHGLLITDVSGDVYTIHDCNVLDRHSRKQLAVYVD